jgi:hypothetical protein
MAHTDERQFDALLDDLVSELAMEEVGEPDEPIAPVVTAPHPPSTPPTAEPVAEPPTGASTRTWLAVSGIIGVAVATLGVAAFVIFGGTRAEAAHTRTTASPQPAPTVEPTPAPEPAVVPVVVPQPAPVAPAETEAKSTETEASEAKPAKASTKTKRKKKKRRHKRKKKRKAPPSGDRFEDL